MSNEVNELRNGSDLRLRIDIPRETSYGIAGLNVSVCLIFYLAGWGNNPRSSLDLIGKLFLCYLMCCTT